MNNVEVNHSVERAFDRAEVVCSSKISDSERPITLRQMLFAPRCKELSTHLNPGQKRLDLIVKGFQQLGGPVILTQETCGPT